VSISSWDSPVRKRNFAFACPGQDPLPPYFALGRSYRSSRPDPLPATGQAVSVDLGVKDFAVTSDEQRIPNPRHLERRAKNLARYQRRLARCQPGSANRAKAKAKAARAHRKVRAARADFLHKTSTRLVRDHDLIVVEDLAVKNMVRNRRVARAISDGGWGAFRVMLEYKAARYGRRVIVIDRWFPSSKTCSACGYVLAELSLKIRAWQPSRVFLSGPPGLDEVRDPGGPWTAPSLAPFSGWLRPAALGLAALFLAGAGLVALWRARRRPVPR
jgi:IS605 OrfB family transposase